MTVATRVKAVVAPILRLVYNDFLTYVPSRRLRRCFLRYYLGALGSGCGIQRGMKFLHAPRIHLGDNVVLNWGGMIDGRHHNVVIGNNVSLGPRVSILTLGHDPQSPVFANKGGEVVIGDRAWVGYGATILPGVTIGEGCVVAARAVVSKDVEDYAIVGGVPARVIGTRNCELTYTLSYDPWLG